MKWLLAVLIVLLGVLQYSLWFGADGIGKTFSLKKKITQQQLMNEELYKKNALLTAEVSRLKKEKNTVETLAREKIGMVKADETYYQIVDEGKK